MTATPEEVTDYRGRREQRAAGSEGADTAASEQGPSLAGPGGLLGQLAQGGAGMALGREMTERVGHLVRAAADAAGRGITCGGGGSAA